MKFSWGTGILIFLIAFLIACGIFMWFAFSQQLNLVHEDYYEKGVDYSHKMEIDRNSTMYRNLIYLQESEDYVKVFFPDDFTDNLKEGSILFFRPSDKLKDIEFSMDIKNNIQLIGKDQLITGRYLVKISWMSDREYFIEKEFFLK